MDAIAHFSLDLRNARAQTNIAAINKGAGPGSALFYDGQQPAIGGATITDQVLLGTVLFAEPAGSVVNGVAVMAAMTDDSSADETGVAQFVRILDGDGAYVMDLSVTDTAGPGPVKMLSTAIYKGGVIHIASFVIAEGNT